MQYPDIVRLAALQGVSVEHLIARWYYLAIEHPAQIARLRYLVSGR